MKAENRITTFNWDLYETRHAVFMQSRLAPLNWKQVTGAPIANFLPLLESILSRVGTATGKDFLVQPSKIFDQKQAE
jgi:hypothetical protein